MFCVPEIIEINITWPQNLLWSFRKFLQRIFFLKRFKTELQKNIKDKNEN